MTYPHNRDDYANSGQQDDYFDQELATAGHEPKALTPEEAVVLDDYANPGQQDDYFDQDLSSHDRPGV